MCLRIEHTYHCLLGDTLKNNLEAGKGLNCGWLWNAEYLFFCCGKCTCGSVAHVDLEVHVQGQAKFSMWRLFLFYATFIISQWMLNFSCLCLHNSVFYSVSKRQLTEAFTVWNPSLRHVDEIPKPSKELPSFQKKLDKAADAFTYLYETVFSKIHWLNIRRKVHPGQKCAGKVCTVQFDWTRSLHWSGRPRTTQWARSPCLTVWLYVPVYHSLFRWEFINARFAI